MRAPYVVLVLPYRSLQNGDFEYALLLRSDIGVWQPVSGGGEDQESPEEAARRETLEETGLAGPPTRWLRLQTVNSIAVTHFRDSHIWGEDRFVIPQYCFGFQVEPEISIRLSHEHTAVRWLPYDSAVELAHFENNRLALWELDRRLRGLGPRD